MKSKKIKPKKNKSKKAKWYFPLVVFFLYLILLFINKNLFVKTTIFFYNLILKIVPILVIIFILMVLTNYYLSNKKIIEFLGEESSLKGLIIAIGGGILSHGPIYVWYPLLERLMDKGMKAGLAATFLYNRAIKIPLLPFMVLYFSWKFVLILTIIMIAFSIIQGMIVDKLLDGPAID